MKKGDPFPFGADPRNVIDDANARLTAFLERSVEVVDCKADVVDSRAAPGDEFSYRRIALSGLEKLHQRVASDDGSDAGPVRIGDLCFLQSQHSGKKAKTRRNRFHGDSDVSDTGALGGLLLH